MTFNFNRRYNDGSRDWAEFGKYCEELDAEISEVEAEEEDDRRNAWQDAEDDLQQDEHDGQPDEAQEWHDFDPDC